MDLSVPHQTATPIDDDARIQQALLLTLLLAHPTPLTVEEVHAQLGDEFDPVSRAIRDLASFGIAHRFDQFVLASQTAVQTAHLLDT